MELFKIKGSYITLGQFIKVASLVSSGGMVKSFLEEEIILINGTKENRRGRKLYSGDTLEINSQVFKFIDD